MVNDDDGRDGSWGGGVASGEAFLKGIGWLWSVVLFWGVFISDSIEKFT